MIKLTGVDENFEMWWTTSFYSLGNSTGLGIHCFFSFYFIYYFFFLSFLLSWFYFNYKLLILLAETKTIW